MNYLTFLILVIASQLSNAAPAGDLPRYEPGVLYLPDKAIALDDGYELSIQGVLGGMVLICCGLMLGVHSVWDRTAAGRNVQSLTGFITFGLITWVMLANFEPESSYGQNRLTIYFIVPFMVGLVSVCFMAVTIQLYLMLIGGLGALAFGLWILAWKDNLSITSTYGRTILLVVLVVAFMLFSLYSCFWVKLGAALAGPYMFFMGLDIYFHTGFLYCFTTVLDPNHPHTYEVHRGVYIMQSCIIIAYIVAYVIQNFGSHHIYRQHSFVMTTSKLPDYQYKSNIRPRYFTNFATFMPPFFHRGTAPIPPAPVTTVI
ncbi:hypothetical protein INT47_005951 [Mucor saturninus]|uniref:TM7S3/TM198-like domain-containing protein n=1 Tax=Mucor saturninus TaxID=64648 RepID=A0A8H7R9I3_9FUNG|nr:hypothetical protein INT47_005951 [Mucor saturninus]